MKLVITDAATVCDELVSLDAVTSLGESEVYPLCTEDELKDRIADAEIIICNKTVFNKAVIDCAPRLKYIGLFATGYNNIDIEYCRERGITVCNVPDYSTEAVAQHSIALLLSIVNRAGEYNETVKRGDWVKSRTFSYFPLPLLELCGKTMGIIGYGSIGRRVGEIARAFGMRVIFHNRSTVSADGALQVPLDTLLVESDVVSLHCPLNDDSYRLINAENLKKMKKGAILINTARGAIVDENALLEALKSGHLRGAGLDVLNTEPMTPDCPLLGAPNCIITPHVAWAGVETRNRLLGVVAENIKAFLAGTPQNTVT